MKTTKRFLCFLLCVALLACSVPVAAYDVPTPYYTATSSITSGLSISADGTATCQGTVALYGSSNYANMTISIQQLKNGGWVSIKSWSATHSKYVFGSYGVSKGYAYRAVTSARVYSASGSYIETPTAYSSIVYY